MTNGELLSRAEDYISEQYIDLQEMRSSGIMSEDIRKMEQLTLSEISGMQKLMAYLYKVIEEEEVE